MNVVNNIIMKRIGEIRPYIRNPRKNEKTVDALVDLIPKVGFNVPIVIDGNGIIVKGHSRYKAAIKLGMETVPCVVTDADEEAIKLDRIADNRVSEFSEWVDEALSHELDMLTMDFSELGFSTITVDDIPDFDDFEIEEETSDEERQARYEQFLAEKSAQVTQVTTQKQLEAAEKNQKPKPRDEYYKCVCEQCGHIMFVNKKDAWCPEQ